MKKIFLSLLFFFALSNTALAQDKVQEKKSKDPVALAKTELAELIEIRKKGEADILIENKIIELDDFLEKTIDGKSVIPTEFKTLTNSNKLDNILNKVDQLLKKLEEDGK